MFEKSFWPTGSGAGLGFFGLFDTAWAILKFAKHEHPLKILVERESVYNLLSQTTPENTKNNHQLYSINPVTRYQNLNSKSCTIDEIRHLYDSDNIPTIDMNNNHITLNENNRTLVRQTKDCEQVPIPASTATLNGIDCELFFFLYYDSSRFKDNNQHETLFGWCKEILDSYDDDEIKNQSKSFQNALAFCAIIHYYRPELMYEYIEMK